MTESSSAYLQWTVGVIRWRSRVADIRDVRLGRTKCAPVWSCVSTAPVEETRRR